jgi:CheY-like chemotaxis protein
MFALPGTSMKSPSSLVLLIEPNDTSRAVYADALHASGFTVVAVADTAAALYAVREMTPQIVIARFDPGTHDECFTLCERLKEDSRTRDIPILLASAGISAQDLGRATAISVLGVSIGPHDGAKMTSAVRGVLAVAQAPQSTPQPEVGALNR